MDFSVPRGTKDIGPGDVEVWVFVEAVLRRLARCYGFQEIRTPIFEHSEVFSRSVGEDSDIVSKEMYTFTDRGGRSLTLRPEGTAAVVRAYLHNRYNALTKPVKLFYYGPMFRYDRPQAGRQRQFHQFGLELFGADHPASDAEVIAFVTVFLEEIGLAGEVRLHINSVGCEDCRKSYSDTLRSFLSPRAEELCADCRNRIMSNPLRVLDCKKEFCRKQFNGMPQITDYICESCRLHFDGVKEFLTALSIPYYVDTGLVRGLDYYCRTAFEFVAKNLGAQSSVGGGGRYNTLVSVFGGEPTPAVGLAMGMERIILLLKERSQQLYQDEGKKVFLAADRNDTLVKAMQTAAAIRKEGIIAEVDFVERSLKARMKYAGKKDFSHVIILNSVDKETARPETIILKDMNSGAQEEITLEEAVKKLTL